MKLTESEEYLKKFIEKNLIRIKDMSITDLSEIANVSTATIVRTAKKLGFSGFSEYKLSLINANKYKKNFKSLKDGEEIENIISKNLQEVNNTINNLSIENIDKALKYLHSSTCIYIFARGLSEQIGQEMEIKFHLLNKRCELYTDPNIIRKIIYRAEKTNAIIYISLGGQTIELVDAAKVSSSKKIPSILLTTNIASKLANLCDIILEGYKNSISYYPEYEVRSRLSLNVLSRILMDAYANRYNKKNNK